MREVCPEVPRSLSDMVAQAMAKKREHRFSDARAMRRALLSAAEAALPPGRRASASVPPELGLPETEVSAPVPVSRAPGSGQGVSTHAATWGDFEGLNAGRILDGGPPPPAGSVPPGAKPQRIVARLGDQIAAPPHPVPAFAPNAPPELLELPAPPAQGAPERPGADRAPARKPRKAGVKSGPAGADALDPLYAGVDQAAPEIDYERVRSAGRKPAPQPAARAKGKSPRSKPKQVAGSSSLGFARALKPWILPLAAVVLAGYALGLPPLRAARGARPIAGSAASAPTGPSMFGGGADPGLKRLRLQLKGRRANPGKAPAHLRDVVF